MKLYVDACHSQESKDWQCCKCCVNEKKKAEVNHFIPMIKKVYVLNQQPHSLFVAGHQKTHEN